MRLDPLQLGPWPRGYDNRHKETHGSFQVGGETLARASAAVNVDLDDEGWPRRRAGVTEIVDATAGLGAAATPWDDIVLFQDGGTIKSVDLSDNSTSSLVTGLSDSLTIQFHSPAGKVFYTNGEAWGIISDSSTATNWGMAVPPSPTLGTTVGTLPAGRYRVSCALVDGNGVLSGAPKATAITLDGTQNITVDLSATDANADFVRVYASNKDTAELYYVGQVAVGALPATITDVNVSNELLPSQFFVGPQGIADIAGIGSWVGFLLVWKGNRIAHSVGNAHHWFDLRNSVWKLPHTVQAVAGIEGPCWVATTKGMFRYTGLPGSSEFERKQMDSRAYAAGSGLVDGDKLTTLQGVNGRVALFASDDGLAIGLPDGQLVHPHDGAVRWAVEGETASFTYRESGDLNQILCNLE